MTVFAGLLGVFLIGALIFDVSKFIIPNWIVGIIIALYPVMILMSPAPIDWVSSLMVFVGMFIVGLGIFAVKLMGGGDVKLLAACSLWIGLAPLGEFLIYVAILGGGLAILLLVVRKLLLIVLAKSDKHAKLPRILETGAPVPYGVAIAGAMFIMIAQHDIPGLTQ